MDIGISIKFSIRVDLSALNSAYNDAYLEFLELRADTTNVKEFFRMFAVRL